MLGPGGPKMLYLLQSENKYVGQGPWGPRSGPEIQVFGLIFDKIGQNPAPEAPFELFPGLSILISPPASVSGHGEAR